MTTFDERLADASYAAGAEDERERIRVGLDAIAETYKNAGVFARCVVSDVRELLAERTATIPNRQETP